MGQKRTPGLFNRKGVWHIDKQVRGRRIRESCGASSLREAETYLARRLEEIRQAEIYGVRPAHRFKEAAIKFIEENEHKRSISTDVKNLRILLPWIGETDLQRINMGTLRPWVQHRRGEGVANGTINHGLKIVRRILNLAASEWMDDFGLTWLESAAKIVLIPDKNKRLPYPLSWDEQDRLFQELPDHLAEMALFKVNTGCRDAEVCNLQWSWERGVTECDSSVFIIPADYVKNGRPRMVVLNDIAKRVVEVCRGRHNTHVFPFRGKPIRRIGNHAWTKARARACLEGVRVHDLKHTYGRRLRAAGVSFEDRQDLLGHVSARVTTDYSAPELRRLIEASNKLCGRGDRRPELVVLQLTPGLPQNPHKGSLAELDKDVSL